MNQSVSNDCTFADDDVHHEFLAYMHAVVLAVTLAPARSYSKNADSEVGDDDPQLILPFVPEYMAVKHINDG